MNNNPQEFQSNQTQYAEDEISLLDFLMVIVANLKLLMIGPILAGVIALGITFLITPTYTAKTTMIPPSAAGGGGAAALLGSLGGLAGLAGGAVKTPTDQYLAYFESNTLRDKLIETYKLRERYKAKYQQQARDGLKNNSKITADKKSGLIQIEVSDKDPKFAAELANSYVDELGQMIGEMSLKESKAKRELLEHQITEATNKTYQSPMVRELIIQALLRDYETTRLEEKKESPFLAQVDIAEVPELKAKPQRVLIAFISSLVTGFILLLWVFIRHSIRNAGNDLGSKEKLAIIKKLAVKQLSIFN